MTDSAILIKWEKCKLAASLLDLELNVPISGTAIAVCTPDKAVVATYATVAEVEAFLTGLSRKVKPDPEAI